MAKLTGAFKFIGSLEDFNAYKNPHSDDIILRKKGGPTKNQIKNNPQFDNTRRLNNEFGGRSTGSKFIRYGLKHHRPVMHIKLHNMLMGHIKPLLKEDNQNEWGQRSLLFSKNTQLLQNFNLNPEHSFESIVRATTTHTLCRHTLSASISIPALKPGNNLIVSGQHKHYRFMASLAIVPDLFFKGDKYYPSHKGYESMVPALIESQWFPVNEGSPNLHLELKFPNNPMNESFSTMLTIGICFAIDDHTGQIEHVKEAGCAKILAST